ncbi:MAG: 2TM domain-containing protein [Acidimicrobiia bacterium]|nr:2TM domain-containing protein [Acidimicrobiia bacterium]
MDDQETSREAAIKRLKGKRDFKSHLATYVVVNSMLVAIWALSGRGYFWPIWPMAGWGIGLVLNAWTVYFQKPISEDEIRREMERGA